MSETSGEPDAEALAYFRLIEEEFLRLRGSVGLLSAADWRIAESWRVAGVPLELVLAAIGEVWRKRQERGGSSRRVSSLKYFSPAVLSAWEEVRTLQGPRFESAARPIDVSERLRRLAEAFPVTYPTYAAWRDRVLALNGEARGVEEALAVLDGGLLEEAKDLLPAERSAVLIETAERRLRPLGDRLSPEQRAESLQRLRDAGVRRHFGLPVLSLFAVGDAPEDPQT
jgi:hypothetical protein